MERSRHPLYEKRAILSPGSVIGLEHFAITISQNMWHQGAVIRSKHLIKTTEQVLHLSCGTKKEDKHSPRCITVVILQKSLGVLSLVTVDRRCPRGSFAEQGFIWRQSIPGNITASWALANNAPDKSTKSCVAQRRAAKTSPKAGGAVREDSLMTLNEIWFRLSKIRLHTHREWAGLHWITLPARALLLGREHNKEY